MIFLVFSEKIEQDDFNRPLEFTFNESVYSLRRQDMILRWINEIAFKVSTLDIMSLRDYYAALKRLYMELTIIFSEQWIDLGINNDDTEIKKIGWKRSNEMLYIEKQFDIVEQKITRIEMAKKIEGKDSDIFKDLEYLEMLLRKMKQTQGMGVKREVITDDEERLDRALGNS